ncbi:hypothetical protein QFC19_003353 [Naganishia cerealis]|uniref:Uncharacterized protein n=1 Tax=Naganishia cerealis TaxID=610337 RepID=A0ACC2W4K2_9TREE|nr:hypothetical protein QFC19_003353 [Naganishia cerealis]
MTNAELAGQYYAGFQKTKAEIDRLLASPGSNASAQVAQLLQGVNKSLTDAAQIKAWQQSLSKQREVSGPGNSRVSKFAFKKRAAPPLPAAGKLGEDVSVREAEEQDASPDGNELVQPSSGDLPVASVAGTDPKSAPPTATTQITIKDLSSTYITLDSLLARQDHAVRAGGFSLTIQNVDKCVIDLRPAHTPAVTPTENAVHVAPQPPRMTALYGTGIRDSLVLAPPTDVAGSVMINDAERVVVITACQQFRIHSSTHAVLLLQIPSNPIIEHSSSLRFGRYPLALSRPPLTPSPVPAVQDFGWIKPGPSPNFRMLDDGASDALGVRLGAVVGGDQRGWEAALAEFLVHMM